MMLDLRAADLREPLSDLAAGHVEIVSPQHVGFPICRFNNCRCVGGGSGESVLNMPKHFFL